MEQENAHIAGRRDAALGYEGKPVWEHLNFQVRSGDYVCIVGENGSGKSTLVKSRWGLRTPWRARSYVRPPCAPAPSAICPSRQRRRRTFPPR